MTDLQLTAEEIQALKDLLVFLATPHPRTGTDLEGNPMLPVAGEVIDAPWGQAAVERLVPRYSTEAVRDASIPSPVDGQLSYVNETGLFDMWNGSEWAPVGDGVFLPLEGGTLIGDLIIEKTYPTVRLFDGAIFWDLQMGGSGEFRIRDEDGDFRFILTKMLAEWRTPLRLEVDAPIGQRHVRNVFYSSTDPGGAGEGDMWIKSVDNTISVRTGGSWAVVIDGNAVSQAMIQPYVDRIAVLEAKVTQLEASIDGP